MPARAIPRLDRAPVDAFALRRLDAERFAGEVEVELELPVVHGAEEIQRLAKIAVRMKAIAISDEVALRDDAVDRGADHQKRSVELAAVEGDEARVAFEETPEFLEDLLLGPGDVRARTGALGFDLRLPRHFIHRAGTPVFDVDHADRDDAPPKRREPARPPRLLGVAFGQAFDQVFADVRVVLFPRDADRLDVDDELFHGMPSSS